ncbi:MAG TPA: helix-turn-helix domain-containing protein [Baekduia sp.]|nr:helix-turn-helix domain-containing protein [Baekduia sp.]
MSSTEPKPLRADARRNRERIVEAARELFAEEGQAAQMDDVARRAGVGVGTVYRHFPTKSALLGELMAAKFRHHAEVARRWAQEEDAWTGFEGFLRETFAAMARDVTLQQRMSWPSDGEAVAHAEEARQVLVEVFGEIIVRAQEQGTLRRDFSVDQMPALMCAIGAVMAAQSPLVPTAEPFIEVVLDGLRATPA